MNDAYFTAFTLLIVGMITVFIILASVVLGGKLIIFIVNKYFSDEVGEKIKKSVEQLISNEKLSAIVSTVDVITKGKGRITKIEKQ